MIQAVILAGGAATRMGGQCKALLNIEGKPFITRLIDMLERAEIYNPLVLTHEWPIRAPQINHLDDSSVGRRLGTGGALMHALPRLADPFMVLNGDSFVPGLDYRAVAAEFRRVRQEGMAGLMVTYPDDVDAGGGNARMLGDHVTEYRKDPRAHDLDITDPLEHTDAGVFITSPDKLSQYAEGAEAPFDLSVIYQAMIRAGVLAGYEVPTVPYEVGSPEGLERYRAAVREGRA